MIQYLRFSLTLLMVIRGVNYVRDPLERFEIGRTTGPAHASLAAYAAQETSCHDQIYNKGSMNLTGFIKYSPVFLVLQAITQLWIWRMVGALLVILTLR